MSDNPNDNDLIEWYLLGKLPDREIRTFKDRLLDDREFARKYRLIKNFPELMSEQGRLEYEKKQIEKEVSVIKEKSVRFQKRWYLFWALVSFIVLLTIAILLIFTGSHHPKEIIVKKENVGHESTIVKKPVVPLKDTSAVKHQPEFKVEENGDATGVGKQKAVELIKPAEGMKFSRKDLILFNWKLKTDTFTRFYIFSEFQDQLVFWRGIRPGIREYRVPGSYLLPGKFYWYVGLKEEKRTFIISE